MFKKLALVLSVLLAVILVSSTAMAAGSKSTSGNTNTSVTTSTYSWSGKVDSGNGVELYMEVTGQRIDGSPTVVFENGNADTHAIWDQVAPTIAQKTRVVTYDRVGMGLSDAPARSTVDYSADGVVDRLHNILTNANIDGPIILVTHSIGGLYSRVYQATYPTDVVGIVFVDSSTEYQFDNLFPNESAQFIYDDIVFNMANGVGTAPIEGDVNDWYATESQVDALKTSDPMRNLPIIVLASGNHGFESWYGTTVGAPMEGYWAGFQTTLAARSNYSVLVTDTVNGHYLHTANPNLVIDATEDMLDLF